MLPEDQTRYAVLTDYEVFIAIRKNAYAMYNQLLIASMQGKSVQDFLSENNELVTELVDDLESTEGYDEDYDEDED